MPKKSGTDVVSMKFKGRTTPRHRGGTNPSGPGTAPIDQRNMVIGSGARMDCTPRKDRLGDTSNKIKPVPMPEGTIDLNKR